jgi:hypothetical protein
VRAPHPYPSPVDELLELGRPETSDWIDYGRLGIGPEHLAPLLRMVNDPRFDAVTDPPSPVVWAPLHSARAISELRDERALVPLLAVLSARHDDDGIRETVQGGLAALGGAAVESCAAYVRNPDHSEVARCRALEAL